MSQSSRQSEIVTAYDEWAETYDTVQNRTRDLAAEVLRQSGVQLNGRRVIEVGCGTGRNTEWLVRQPNSPAEIVALDFSEEMLRRAKARIDDPRVRFIKHNASSVWPFADHTVDLVIAMLILEHVERLEPVFAEAGRTLTVGGELFVCELHPARQMLGKQAQFTSAKTGEHKLVASFLHETEDYLNAARSAGLELLQQTDWWDKDASAADSPRLLSLLFRQA